jgi:hypothetical protein
MDNVILLPRQPRFFRVKRGIHKVPDRAFNGGIRMHLLEECGNECTAVFIRSCGEGIIWPAQPYLRWYPEPEKIEWARDMVVRANDEVGHHGCWAAAWIDAAHCKFMWFDMDGDLQLEFTVEDPWPRVVNYGMDYYLGLLEQTIAKWVDFWKGMEVREDQKIKAALGQTAPNT